MTAAYHKKPTAKGKAKGWAFERAKAYRFEDGSAFLLDAGLPENAGVFVVPETPAADAKIRARWAVKRCRTLASFAVPIEPRLKVSPEAYRPSARAKAVLRGVAIAEEDLKAADGTYEVDEVRALLRNVSRQAVDKRVADGSLLAVPGPSGVRRFPAAQFATDGSVVKGLKEVQAALGFESKWSVLNFLVNKHDLLGNERPIDVLHRGDVGRVVEAARLTGVQGA